MLKWVKRLYYKIKHWIYRRVSGWDVGFQADILTPLNLKQIDTGIINKDDTYWKLVAAVRDNHPYMNEMQELQETITKRILAELALDVPDLDKIRAMRHQLKGVGSCAGIIRKAIEKSINGRT